MTDNDLNFNIDIGGKGAVAKPAPIPQAPPQNMGGPAPAQGPGQGSLLQQRIGFLARANHPLMCLVHLFFRTSSLLCYLLFNLFVDNEILTFIVVVLLCAFDFWVVKNITGRILVGLRWWSEIKEDGSEVWIFESLNQKANTGSDSFIFWSALYIAPLVWIVFLILNFLRFKLFWFNVVLVALILSCANLIGYWKCEKDQKKRMKNFFVGAALGSVMNGILGGGNEGNQILGAINPANRV